MHDDRHAGIKSISSISVVSENGRRVKVHCADAFIEFICLVTTDNAINSPTKIMPRVNTFLKNSSSSVCERRC